MAAEMKSRNKDVEQGSDDTDLHLPQRQNSGGKVLKGAEPAPSLLTVAWVRGDPGPFGLLCFGMTTCMLMFITTTWAEGAFKVTVMSYAAFYGGMGQLLAGLLELIKGNTFGGTAFASYGCFWMGWCLMEYWSVMYPQQFPLGAAMTGRTLWCGLWSFLTFGFFIVTCRKNGCLMTIFSTLVLCFALLAGGVHSARCEEAAGYVGFFCGASAIYAALAFLYKEELGYVLPGANPVHFI